jgi:hypothetical protein
LKIDFLYQSTLTGTKYASYRVHKPLPKMCYEPILKNIFVVVMVGRVVTDPSLGLSSPYEVVPQVLILVNEAKKHAKL